MRKIFRTTNNEQLAAVDIAAATPQHLKALLNVQYLRVLFVESTLRNHVVLRGSDTPCQLPISFKLMLLLVNCGEGQNHYGLDVRRDRRQSRLSSGHA